MLTVPCGVVTHAGRHTATLCYTNNTVIASTSTHVAWPSLAIAVPTRCSSQQNFRVITLLSRIETFTLDVAVTVSFTTNVCSPLSVMGNNNNQRVLQGDHIHTVVLWRIYLQFVGLFNPSNIVLTAGGRRGEVGVWLQVQRCDSAPGCDSWTLDNIVRLDTFYSALR